MTSQVDVWLYIVEYANGYGQEIHFKGIFDSFVLAQEFVKKTGAYACTNEKYWISKVKLNEKGGKTCVYSFTGKEKMENPWD